MKYRSGYKYQLAEDEWFQTDIFPKRDIITEFIWLTTKGLLLLKGGYASDGPSGPTKDRKTNMRGAFGHDGIYQLIRHGHLPPETREKADDLLQKWWIEDGMWTWVAKLEVKFVKRHAAFAADPKNIKKIYEAP